jgi:trk system potassium uptake protein TrkA
MRIVFNSASPIAVAVARMLIAEGHDVVMVEADETRIDALSRELDCGFIHGDGSHPSVLKEVGPESSDFLFCLSDSDQSNIITSLVGRELEFGRVVTKIEDTDFESICTALKLQDVVVPQREAANRLADIVSGIESLNLAAIIRGDVRLYSFSVPEKDDHARIGDLGLPEGAMAIAVSRDDKTIIADAQTKLKRGDEVAVITYEKNLEQLDERFGES